MLRKADTCNLPSGSRLSMLTICLLPLHYLFSSHKTMQKSKMRCIKDPLPGNRKLYLAIPLTSQISDIYLPAMLLRS